MDKGKRMGEKMMQQLNLSPQQQQLQALKQEKKAEYNQ